MPSPHSLVSPQLFADAQAQDRLVFVWVAAPWSHWSQKLEQETLPHPSVQAALEADYLLAQLDHDEHPEFDRRLQDAVQLLGVGGGWPLCAFITPEGQLAFGTAYVPPEDDERMKRKGLAGILRQVATAWREQPTKLRELGGHIVQVLGGVEAGEREGATNAPPPAVDTLAQEALDQVARVADPNYAGIASDGPKFPHPTLWEFLLSWAASPPAEHDDERRVHARTFASRSLSDMAMSGLYDHLGDGFHRYCLDPHWNVPEFEKLASDNAALLRAYSLGSRVLAEPFFAHVATNTARWLMEALLAGDGGFYHAQYATRSGDEPGLYYGWTLRQVQDALGESDEADEALAAFSLYFGVHKQGDLLPPHRDVNVLRVSQSVAEVAEELGVEAERAETLIQHAAETLREARRARNTAPPVDERLFTASTAEVAASLLHFARAVPESPLATVAEQQALKALDRLLRDAYEPGLGMSHRLDEEGREAEAQAANVRGRRWLLADQAWSITALLAGFGATAQHEYLDAARSLVNVLNRYLWHKQAGGYYDVLRDEADQASAWPAVLSVPRRPVADDPAASGNGLMLRALVQLYLITNEESFLDRARWVAEGLASAAQQRGFLASTFCLGASEIEELPPLALVAGSRKDSEARELWQAARRHAPLSTQPILLDPEEPQDAALVAAHGAELLDGKPALYVYVGRQAKEPVTDVQAVDADTFRPTEAEST